MLKLPDSFKEKYQHLLGLEESEKMFSALNKESKKAFRINPLKYEQNISYSKESKVPDLPMSYYGEVSGQDSEWVSGTVYSQDPAAMFPAYIADIQPGEKVLDLCAAPGGKSTALGEALNGQGILVANEISSTRVKALRENIERWGISNALITNEDSANLSKNFTCFFDKILVDAPCSGEGMFRKNPDAISYWSPEYVQTCQERQKEILNEAVKMLKPGGKLIYSTCTFSPEEDEEIVSWLVNKFKMTILPIEMVSSKKISHGKNRWGNVAGLERTLRFWPQDDLGEGQFVALLQANGEGKPVTKSKKKKSKKQVKDSLSKNEKELITKVINKFNLPTWIKDWQKNALVSHNHVFIPAVSLSQLKGLKIVNNGLELGILKKNRFEPGHQLAEVLGDVKQERVVNLSNQDEYLSYLHGETVKVDTELKGFVLVAYRNMIFSFGKVAGNNVLKNFYPKGLRILKKE